MAVTFTKQAKNSSRDSYLADFFSHYTPTQIFIYKLKFNHSVYKCCSHTKSNLLVHTYFQLINIKVKRLKKSVAKIVRFELKNDVLTTKHFIGPFGQTFKSQLSHF